MNNKQNQAENNEIKAEELSAEEMKDVNGGGFLDALEYASDRVHCFFGMHGELYCAQDVYSQLSDINYIRYECTICGKSVYYKKRNGGKEEKISEEEFNRNA